MSVKDNSDSIVEEFMNQIICHLDSLVYLRVSRFTDFSGFSVTPLAKDLKTTLNTSPSSLFHLSGSKEEEQFMFNYNCNDVLSQFSTKS